MHLFPLPTAIFALALGVPAQGVLDQSQTSFSTTVGGDRWQSFTAGMSGRLCQIDVDCQNPSAGGQLEIYAGEGTGGVLLGSQAVDLVGGVTSIEVAGDVVLGLASVYTIRLTATNAWRLATANPYAGGQASAGASTDFWFRTFVDPCLRDQQQTTSNTSAGGDRWQSFTAGCSGLLCQVDVSCQNALAGSTLEIYQGEGTAGTRLAAQAVDLSGGVTSIALESDVPVATGHLYTMRLTGTNAWRLQASGPYALGRSSVGAAADFWFRTYVKRCRQDQEQTTSNTSAGGDRWQSFTPAISGRLCRVAVSCQLARAGAEVEILAGEGTGGALLAREAVDLNAAVTVIEPSARVDLDAGSTYTLRLTSANAWRLQVGGSYAGGRSSVGPNDDFWFETWMTGPLGECTFRNGSGINAADYAWATVPAIGGNWITTIATDANTTSTLRVLSVRAATLSYGPGELLFDPMSAVVVPGAATLALPVPSALRLVGDSFTSQGARVENDGGQMRIVLLNAIDAVIGT